MVIKDLKVNKSKYWDIKCILPYQRKFNFINGERSIGKTYSTLKFVINKAIENKQEFVYIVRTRDEKNGGIFRAALDKVIMYEFPDLLVDFNNEEMYTYEKDDKGKVIKDTVRILGYCLALSESSKIKKRSFPRVYYLVFDEYMLEKGNGRYVQGHKEPDLLLNIYHTIDREEDRVICFLLGNNTTFYNPYHLHSAFKIPSIKKGQIYYDEFLTFVWATSTQKLKDIKNKSKFIQMIDKTNYGKYAKDGDYTEDSLEFIQPMERKLECKMIIIYNGENYGVYFDQKKYRLYISDKYDKECQFYYALTLEDHNENTMLTRDNKCAMLKWLKNSFKLGCVRYISIEVKKKAEGIFKILL